MKILLVSDIFYPHTGGVSEHILHLWKNFNQMGHTTKILAPSYGKNYPYVHENIIRMGRAIKFPKNRSFSVLSFGITIPWQVRRFLESEKFDVIHLHGAIAPTLPYLALKYSNAKNFVTFHSAYEESFGYVLWEPVLEQYFRRIDGMIAVSTVARDCVMRYFPIGECRIIPNGIDTERFRPDVPPIEELQKYSPKILFVGRFEPRKGLKYLLMAFPEVVKEFPEAKLIVVGEGFLEHYYRRYIEEHIKDNVIFVGFVKPEELPRYYSSCDIYCSPATGAESFGIVLLEAMASGKPIVASDIPGYRTILSDGVEGVLFEPMNPEALAEKIIYLLKKPDLMKKFGNAGREKSKKYDWKIVAKQVLDFYTEVCHSKS
ncbi:MAG: glycosyltransferase family 4 protein [candidate division WOR-3 bacterium]